MTHNLFGTYNYGIILVTGVDKKADEQAFVLQINCYPLQIYCQGENQKIQFGIGLFGYRIGIVLDTD